MHIPEEWLSIRLFERAGEGQNPAYRPSDAFSRHGGESKKLSGNVGFVAFISAHETLRLNQILGSYQKLPSDIRASADKNYDLLKNNPRHPSLPLKKVGRYWSVRAGHGYRAKGVDVDEGVLWIWIGAHDEYER